MTNTPVNDGGKGLGNDRWWAVLPAGLLALGLAMRVLGAWSYEYAHTSDHGIICLMVKHMLEGREFPVFFYGLPYMGSIEPVVSALLCALFGLTGFWINMGTALVAFAFLPLVYLWGRGAAGRAGGLAALAFCAIGPPQYFQFESWADGGYAAIPLLTCAILLLSVRMLVREAGGDRNTHFQYLLLGVVAGLGWWQSPLLIPAFIVCALLFLAVLRGRLFTARLVSGALGFFLGSAPLWVWNFRHHWQTFDMVKTHDSPSLIEGLKLFYLTRIPDLFELFRHPPVFRIALGALLILLAGLAVARLVSARRGAARGEFLHLAAAFLFLIVFSILFGRSRFARVNALRYVLILIPVLGVLLGAATAWLTARVRWGLGWLPLVALVALQAVELPHRFQERRETAAFVPVAREFGAYLRSRKIKNLYADYQVRRANHGLNFLLNEEFVFSPLSRERYRPYARALERAEHPAVLNALMGFDSFLTATRSTARIGGVVGLTAYDDIRPPPDNWRLAPDSEIQSISPLVAGVAPILVRFLSPQRLVGVRVVSDEARYPTSLGLEAWNEASQQWVPLMPVTPATRYFWSGPRFYWGGSSFRLDYRFDPVETERLRIRVKSSPRSGPCEIRTLQFLVEDGTSETPPGKDELDRLAKVIRERGFNRIYSDRWEANGLADQLGNDVLLSLPPYVFDRVVLSAEMTLDERTAIVVRERESEPTRRALLSRGVAFREIEAGPWRVFGFAEEAPLPPHARAPGLRWAGFGCLTERDREWALLAQRDAQALLERKAFGQALALAELALPLYPRYRPLVQTLAACYEATGETKKAAEYRQLADVLWTPAIPVPARFEQGLELLGATLDAKTTPGGTFQLKLYWRCPPVVNPAELTVYVHIQAGKTVVCQDDHPFLAGFPLDKNRPADEVFVEERIIQMPRDVAPGELQIELGLYRPQDGGRRLKVKSEFGRGGKTVVIPVPLIVVPSSAQRQD